MGITKDTLYYYEKEGLLPLIKRDKLNRRFYSEYPDFKECDQIFETLQFIGITVPIQDDYVIVQFFSV
ncbi:MAG: MerR family DNA-binding transcriptional regulator [Clostridiales bacterium]|nr:MerR family DNA-binding transcriptional regulator [Clostridiales bacterium]